MLLINTCTVGILNKYSFLIRFDMSSNRKTEALFDDKDNFKLIIAMKPCSK